MRSKTLGGLLAAAALLCAFPAYAADNYAVRDGLGAQQTFCSKLASAVQWPCHLVGALFGGVPGLVQGGQQTKANSLPVVLPSDPDVRNAATTVTAADAASTTVAGQGSVTLIQGSPTAGSAAIWQVNGHSSLTIQATGIFSLTAPIEESADCATYAPATAKILGTGATTGTITAPGVFRVDTTGMACVRVRATSYTSGTLSVVANASAAPGLSQVLNPVPLLGVDAATKVTSGNPLPTQCVSGCAGSGNVGGYSFQLSPTITVQNAAYSAGNSLGGLITLTGAARTNGGTGTLQGLRIKSAGGLTPTLWIYAWSKAPASTCTDKTAFVANAADSPYAIPGFPLSVTLSNPGSWETATYGELTGLGAVFKNQDSSAGTAIYFCIVTAGAITPASTSDISEVASGYQD